MSDSVTGVVVGAQCAFVDDDRFGEIVRQAHFARGGAESAVARVKKSLVGDLRLDLAGQRNPDPGELRQGEDFVRDIGGYKVADTQADAEGACLAAELADMSACQVPASAPFETSAFDVTAKP